jgi:predicted amidohydrolase
LIRGAPDADLYVLPELAPTGYLVDLALGWLWRGTLW